MAENDWATPSLKEVPFWRDGMSPDEYEVERAYLYNNFFTAKDMMRYVPIWKQKKSKIS